MHITIISASIRTYIYDYIRTYVFTYVHAYKLTYTYIFSMTATALFLIPDKTTSKKYIDNMKLTFQKPVWKTTINAYSWKNLDHADVALTTGSLAKADVEEGTSSVVKRSRSSSSFKFEWPTSVAYEDMI